MDMIRILPKGACPICNYEQFVVHELQSDIYLTNRDGEIIDSKECTREAKGLCLKCGAKIDMLPTNNGFIPMTPLRKLIYDYHTIDQVMEEEPMENPMMLKKD